MGLNRWKSDHTMNWYISKFYVVNSINILGLSYYFFLGVCDREDHFFTLSIIKLRHIQILKHLLRIDYFFVLW